MPEEKSADNTHSLPSNLKGLEVARRFFEEWGLPYLRSEFPQISERMACFLCGGSQSLGNDDARSRDHQWGPGFTILLTGQDMHRSGESLQNAINKAAPREWLEYRFRNPNENIEVQALNPWFRSYTKFVHPPKTLKTWLRVHEANLYMLRHATVFHDPLGEFTARREGFKCYPPDARMFRVTESTFSAWHYGQYNFLDRLAHRRDSVAISICLGMFMQATMRLCMFLNGDYAPYWKWLHAEFRKQPNVAELDAWISELSTSDNLADQVGLVDTICKDLYSRLVKEELVSEKPTGHPHPLMCAHMELSKRCQ